MPSTHRAVITTLFAVLLLSAPSGYASSVSAPPRPGPGTETDFAEAQEPLDWEMVDQIRHEGFGRSHIEETLHQLVDAIGPRLTGSPAMLAANRYTRDTLDAWGLQNARLEAWGPFGRGWSFSHSSIHVIAPRPFPLVALPLAWTPGTDGPRRGELLRVQIESKDDFDRLRGTLANKIVLLDRPREVIASVEPPFKRFDDNDLERLTEYQYDRQGRRPPTPEERRQRRELQRQRNAFFAEEGVLAVLHVSRYDNGIVSVSSGGSRDTDEGPGVPQMVVASEHYNLLSRLLDEGEKVELEINVTARFYDDDPMAYNTVAEIPGSDLSDQLVMVGAHLDSWHAAGGATDNAAGVAVAMEAVRILHALGVVPRRTIRIALWSGEEQGLLGSRAYVGEHFAKLQGQEEGSEDAHHSETPDSISEAPEQTATSDRRSDAQPTEPAIERQQPAYDDFSAYFNLDNGSGKIRGIYTQRNAAVRPIFRRWLEPFGDLGAETVSINNTGGTDHLSFDRVGLPGFQFIQDRLDYSTHTHHTNIDTYDHLEIDDLKQASVILASFLYHAAMRDQRLPRKPLAAAAP